MAGECQVHVEPGEEGGLDQAEDRSGQLQDAAEAEVVGDEDGEGGLQHETGEVPPAPVLEGFGQPGRQRLEGDGEERQAIDERDGVAEFEAVVAGTGRPAPGGEAVEEPAQRVHRPVVEVEPPDIADIQRGRAADQPEQHQRDEDGRQDGRAFGGVR